MDNTPGFVIRRAGQDFGPYTLQQVHDYLTAGNLVLTDTAWDPRNSTWVALAQLPGLTFATPPPPPPVAPPPAPFAPVQATQPRNIFWLIFMGIVWFFVLLIVPFFLICAVGGGIAGALHPDNAHDAGAEAGRILGTYLGVPLFLLALVLSIVLTALGKLPGTRK